MIERMKKMLRQRFIRPVMDVPTASHAAWLGLGNAYLFGYVYSR